MADRQTLPVPGALLRLIENTSEVRQLHRVVRELSGGRRGPRPGDTETLKRIHNKSALVLVVASWEAFIEDVAMEAFDFMLAQATTPSVYPAKVLVLASAKLTESKDVRSVWELAGDGWRTVLLAYRDEVRNGLVEPFHSPRADKIDILIESLVGYRVISTAWHWKGTSVMSARSRLDELINRRGEIAHRVRPRAPVYQREVAQAIDLISRLAAITSRRLAEFVHDRTGKWPWRRLTYRNLG